MALKDYKWLFNTDILQLKQSSNPFWDYYVFDFTTNNSTWETWEHAFFILPEKIAKDRWFRPLSIASNHEEWIIRVATKISDSPSEYKKYLKSMKPGDIIKIRWPFGSFKILNETSPIVLIAGWIGIAPMRALLDRVKNDTNRDIVLLYSSNDWYIFKNEFDEIKKNNKKVTIHYITWRNELSTYINQYSSKYQNNGYYYLSGTIPMIKSVTKTLKTNNISGKRLLNDPFYGY
jgi:predicted ferric reductase